MRTATLDKYVQAYLDANEARRLEYEKRHKEKLEQFWTECHDKVPAPIWKELHAGGVETVIEKGSELHLPVTLEGVHGVIRQTYYTAGNDFELTFGVLGAIRLYGYVAPETWGRLILDLREAKQKQAEQQAQDEIEIPF